MISFSMHVAYSVFGCTGVIRSSLISFCPSGVAPGGAVYGISTSMRTCDWLSCCAGFLPTSPDGSAAAKQHNTVDDAERGAAESATKGFWSYQDVPPDGFQISEISGVCFSLDDKYNEARRRQKRQR